jgi:hypothetical protein
VASEVLGESLVDFRYDLSKQSMVIPPIHSLGVVSNLTEHVLGAMSFNCRETLTANFMYKSYNILSPVILTAIEGTLDQR